MDLWFNLAAVILLAVAAVVIAMPPVLRTPYGARWAISVFVIIALAAVAGATAIVLRPDPLLEVTFSEPRVDGPKRRPGKDVRVVGMVRNLPKGHQLWIASKPFEADSYYYVAAGSPAVDADGTWDLTDKEVGDDSDYGGGRFYYAINANEKCSAVLAGLKSARRLYTTPTNPTPDYEAVKWPAGCKLEGQATRIDFMAKR